MRRQKRVFSGTKFKIKVLHTVENYSMDVKALPVKKSAVKHANISDVHQEVSRSETDGSWKGRWRKYYLVLISAH